MPKFQGFGTVTGSKYLGEVEAENAEEAKKLFEDCGNGIIALCHSCSRECEDPQVTDIDVQLIEEGDSDES